MPNLVDGVRFAEMEAKLLDGVAITPSICVTAEYDCEIMIVYIDGGDLINRSCYSSLRGGRRKYRKCEGAYVCFLGGVDREYIWLGGEVVDTECNRTTHKCILPISIICGQ